MRLIAIFVLLIFLIMFIAPSLGQQTPDQTTLNAQKCADLNGQLDQLMKDKEAVNKQPASEDKTSNLNYYDAKISTVNNLLILNGCKKGNVTELPPISGTSSQSGNQTGSQPRSGTITAGANGTSKQTSDPWEGTWSHRGGTLELKQNTNALDFLGEPTSPAKGPRIPNYIGTTPYAGILTWNTPPYDSKPLRAAVFAFIDGDKLKARFTTAYSAFEAVLPGEQYNSEERSLIDQNKADGILMGKFEVQKSGSDRFTGTMSPVQIIQGNEALLDPPYQEQGQYAFDAEKRTSP